VNINSANNNIQSNNFTTANISNTRQPRNHSPSGRINLTPTVQSAVDFSVSPEAQRLFELKQMENATTTRFQEFVIDDSKSISTAFNDLSTGAMNFLNRANQFANNEIRTGDNALMAEFGYKLIGGLAHTGLINPNIGASDHAIDLANRYVELRESLLEQFYGEELEKKLNALSQAFDFAAEIQSEAHELSIRLELTTEMVRIAFHNAGIEQGVNEWIKFDSEHITQNTEEISRIAAAVREAMLHFTHQARQFILENGVINTQQDRENVTAFLQNDQRADGGLTLDQLNTTHSIVNRHHNGSRGVQNETMFTEISRLW